MRRLLLAAIAAAVVAAGCGADSLPSTPSLAAAVKHSDAVESYRMDLTVASDLGNETFHMTGEARGNADGTKMRGTFDYTQDGERFPFEMVLIDDEAWMRSKKLTPVLPKGATWMRMQDKELAQQSLTAEQFIDLLRDEDGIEEVGRERVRGIDTVHLRGPLDLQEMLDRVGSGPVYDKFRKSPELLEQLSASIDAWIAGDRLHRITLEMRPKAQRGKMTMTADLLDEDVSLDDVQPPPAAQVADEDEVSGP